MVIDLREVKQKGLLDYQFEFDFTVPDELLALPNASAEAAAKLSGVLHLYDDEAKIEGTMSFKLVGECSRCLEKAECEVVIPFEEKFVPQGTDDDDAFFYERSRIDLTEMAKNLILTGTPLSIYCKEDCLGLCPVCGTNLNVKSCGCGK